MKSVIVAFAAILLIIALPFVYLSIDNAITDEVTQSFSGVGTAAGIFTANVTLGKAIFRDDVSQVKEISSSITPDVPSAYSFNTVTRALEVSGLEEDTSRTLSVTFYIDSVTLEDFAITIFSLFRWFYLFVILGMAGGAIYAFFD